MSASVVAMSDRLERTEFKEAQAPTGQHRREFHGMRYQLADEWAQLSFAL